MFNRIFHFIVLIAVVTSLLVITPATPVLAFDTWTVTKTADTNDGACDADCSLREAIDVAASGDTIDFDPSLGVSYTEIVLTSNLVIDKDLTISGPGSDVMGISGNNS